MVSFIILSLFRLFKSYLLPLSSITLLSSRTVPRLVRGLSAKTKVMTGLPRWLQLAQIEKDCATQQARDAVCNVCGAGLAAESLQSHLETLHHIYRSFVLNQDLIPERAAVVYRAIGLPATGIYLCLVPECGGKSGTRFNLCRNFLMQHFHNLVCIPIEGSQPLPQCAGCGLQTPVEDLNQDYCRTGLC